jgi:hypothetical protein
MSDVYIPPNEQRGTSMKWFFGCSCGCITILFLLIALFVAAVFYIKGLVTDWQTEFREMGFERIVRSQELNITETVSEPTLFFGQNVIISGTITTNVAIIAMTSEISSTIDGNVYFRGQVLKIKETAVLKKDLDVYCQIVDVKGTVEGDITGTYQVLHPPPSKTE